MVRLDGIGDVDRQGASPSRLRGRGPALASSDAAAGNGAEETAEERLRRRSTPLVRRIAAEHDVDIADVEGSGRAGRVTKPDIMAFLDQREKAPAGKPGEKAAPSRAPGRQPAPAGGGAMGADQLWELFYGQVQHPEWPVREGDEVKPMDRIRKLTADHMVLAKRMAPHVHSFIEIDFTRLSINSWWCWVRTTLRVGIGHHILHDLSRT